MAEVRKCGYCDERIRGRSDKKFCNDVCRNAFNNRVNGELNASIRSINSKLKKNRRVLESLLPKNVPFIQLKTQTLLQKGFLMNYFTHTLQSPKGSIYFFCYDYGYTSKGEDVVLVKKKIYE
jgi:predicted metal-dependent RNase